MLELSKLKISYLAGTLGQGGAERQLFHAVQALRGGGASVQVLSLERDGFWKKPMEELGVPVTWLGPSRSRLKRVCALVKQLKDQPPDILQSQHFYTNAYTSVSSFFLNCRAIGALRSNGQFDVSQCGRVGGRINLHLPKLLAANSRSSIRYAIRRGVPASRLFFLPNVVDTERFKPAVPDSHKPITLLTVGRLSREKRFDRFISLVHQLRTRCGLDVRGCIVGSNREGQDLRCALERQAMELNLRSDVLQFLGAKADMASIYKEAALFVLTSEHEGTPNVLLEAMASGLPVLATNVGGVPEIVQHGWTGFLVNEHNTSELMPAARQLIENPKLRLELGTRARSYVDETHSVQRLPAYLAALYASALEHRARPEPEEARKYARAKRIGSSPMLNFIFRRSNDHERIV
jgi:glycosyltransferase involved in cell wall biosynthesis